LSFSALLERICALEGKWRCRLSSLDPRFLNEKKMDLITGEPRVCPHFHISLQHGSDRVIARMGRRITTADYRRILDALRERAPEAALGTDIIVGFPGETEEDFREMKNFLEESPLTYFHVFSFSPRPGTPAAEWEPVHSETVKRRAALLRGLAREKRRAFRQGKIGRESEAVVIRGGDKGARVLTGDFIDVRVPACPVPASRLVRVRLTGIEGDKARGVLAALEEGGEDRP
jgi:threonylcarbamoyladenosine tRNA methylthiotransferase MtaB